MATESTSPASASGYELLEERIAYLELLKSFHEEVVKIIRNCAADNTIPPERCLQEIVEFIQGRFDLYTVSIFLMDEPSGELSLLVCAGFEPPDARGFPIRAGEGLVGHCAKTGETVLVDDVERDPRFVRGPFADTRSETCVAIKMNQRIVGVLDLQDRRRGHFRADFAKALEEIALSIGFVLETKKLYDDLQRHSQSLERRVAEKIARLGESEERYRTIVENAVDPILIVDMEGLVSWANRAFTTVLGYPNEEILRTNLTTLVKKGNLYKLYHALKDVGTADEAKAIQITLVSKTGEGRTFEATCLGLRTNGEVAGMEINLRDVTEKNVVERLTKNYMHSLEEAVIERTAEIKDTQRAAILAIANLAESIDDDTGGHIQRIRHYSKRLAEELKANSRYQNQIADDYVDMIYDLSPLHDLGKVGIRDYILQKPDKLTEAEFEKMKDHTEIGAHALRMAGAMIHRDSIFSIGEMIARFHHEKWDGTGYPAVDVSGERRPLHGEEIPLCARIVAVADVYDALTSKRPYKMPFPHERARDMILRESGKHFDPEIVSAFLRCEQDFIGIRNQFPDTEMPQGRPFELPERDR